MSGCSSNSKGNARDGWMQCLASKLVNKAQLGVQTKTEASVCAMAVGATGVQPGCPVWCEAGVPDQLQQPRSHHGGHAWLRCQPAQQELPQAPSAAAATPGLSCDVCCDSHCHCPGVCGAFRSLRPVSFCSGRYRQGVCTTQWQACVP